MTRLALLLLLALPAQGQDMRTLFNQGIALDEKGDIPGAVAKWEQGLSMARRAGAREAMANFTRNLGFAYTNQGDYPKAAASLEEAASLFSSLNLPKGQAGALSGLGQVLTAQGRYSEAISTIERALAVHERLGDHLGVSICLRGIGNAHAARGEYKTAVSFYERSSKLAVAVRDERGHSADLTNLAISYKNMGRLPEALYYAKSALELDERLGAELAMAEDLSALGNVHAAAGRLAEALSAHERALSLMKRSGARDGESDALINIAAVLEQRGDFARAGELLERALELKRELGDSKGEAVCLQNLAALSGSSGDLAAALRHAEAALSISQGQGDFQGQVSGLQAVGDVRRRLGDYKESAAALGEALLLTRRSGDTAAEGRALGGLASLYVEVGDWDRALAFFSEALSAQRRAQARVDEAATLNNLAVARRARGDWAEAEKVLRESLALARELGVPAAEQELGLADAAAERGELAEAEKEYRRLDAPIALGRLYLKKGDAKAALSAFERSAKMGEDSPDPLALYAESTGLGQALLLQGEHAKAEEAFSRASVLAEAQREGLDDAQRSGFFEGDALGFRRAEAYEGLIAAAAAAGRADDAFERAEGLKARVLAEAIARAELSRSAGLPPALRAQEEGFESGVRALRRESEALFKAGDKEARAKKEEELGALKRRQAEFVRGLRAEHPEYAAVRYPRPLRPAEVALSTGEVLVEFAFAGDKVYRFVVRGQEKTAALSTLPASAKRVAELVRAYRAGFEEVSSASDLAALDLAPGRELHDLLLKGVARPGERLIVVPDGALGLLPFEALVVSVPAKLALGQGEHGPFPLGARYLGDETEVTYAQSAATLSLLRARARAAEGGLALAVVDPSFGGVEPAVAAWRAMGAAGTRAKGARAAPEAFPRLEKTRELGALFTRLFPGAQVLQGERAGKKELAGVDLSSVRYAVFGTHGLLDAEVPYAREPALVLSGGLLTMSEVMALKLPAEVVALTACQTGVGKSVGGEGVMGMGRAFQYAGAESVLMSLWPVAEDGSVALTSAFFTALKEGAAPRAALRRARETVRRAGYEHPFYWAAFILVSR